ncbi:MAG: hypothetical protein L0387_46105 [Acidobacteria bacterium]|nr:hypothetical protein [Acidobacteriota bacterium]
MLFRGLACVFAVACSLGWFPAAAFAQATQTGKSLPPEALLQRYLDLKRMLLSQRGDAVWSDLQGKLTPLMRLTVTSADPTGEPATLRLAPNPDGPAEVTLLLERPPSFEVVPGRQVNFQGVARELGKEPFQLSLVDASIWLPPVVMLSVEPKAIKAGETAALEWNTREAFGVVLFPDGLELGLAGSRDVSPRQTTTYTIAVRGWGGEAEASVVVTVQPDSK